MPEKTVTVRVTHPAGRYITGYGQREMGQTFELPAALASELAARDPGLEIEQPLRAKAAKADKKDDEA